MIHLALLGMSFLAAPDDRTTTAYDVRDLVAKPPLAAARAAKLAREIMTAVDGLEGVEVLNGTQLVIRASKTQHQDVAQLLSAWRRLTDVTVKVQTRLYEVDEAFYTRLKNARHVPLEELEERFIAGKPPPEDSLFKRLEKLPVAQKGAKIQADDGAEVLLLARQTVAACRPSGEQLRRGVTARQTFVQGVEFRAGVRVAPDRRLVRLDYREQATALQEIEKTKVVDARGNRVDAERPLLRGATQSRLLEVPDNGSILVPVHYRPGALEAAGRWWVLEITPRIIIPEEERQRNEEGKGH